MNHFAFNQAIVRTPSASVVHGLRAGCGPDPSLDGIRREHAAYSAALETAGLTVTVLPPLEEFPDAVFVEDPALVFTNGAILLRPGAPTRRAEALALEPHLRERFGRVLAIDEGCVDGGDVLVMPDRTLIGLSARTDLTGAELLVELLAQLGRQGRVVHTPPGVLHLKSACSLLDQETILVTPALAASGIFDGCRVLTVPEGEEGSANVLRLHDTVLASASCALTLDLLDRNGFTVLPLQTVEISKLDAGLSCMSLRWVAAPTASSPKSRFVA
jgi:dimethylargininase